MSKSSQALLIGTIYYEVKKRDGIYMAHALWDATEAGIHAFATKLDEWYPEKDPTCDNSIMCLREGKRHRKTCPLNRNYTQSCPEGKQFTCRNVHNA